ncbi:MAG TPA: FAD-dependent oxidoreductase [Solirubrobacteraceae bacterium]|jgi:glycine/D-amino acid oxidase-like deaminating enzyme|nr:FAD-dependent oxidoreductase [Solirubrobacteraceae bacterium]
MEIVIVGAGTFGASLAWWLARGGEAVTLVDQFEPGDRRASSGGETRLLRSSHGADGDYTAMARRARTLWHELEAESGETLVLEPGVAWFAHGEAGWEADSARTLTAQGIPVERLDLDEAARLYPSLGTDDLAFVLLEPEAGVVRAQRAVRTLADRAAAHGASVVRGRARSGDDPRVVVLDDGTRLSGDVVVWACGGWLSRLFPALVSIKVTRQELLFVDGGPAWEGLPGWVDYDRAMYGTGDVDGIGVKAALDLDGPPLDPDEPLTDEPTTEAAVRAYLRDRFPALEHAPLAETRACRYELSPDSHFLAAGHPDHDDVWLVGGGSGHGFKHGPAMAERLAAAITSGEPLPPRFALGHRTPARGFRTAGSWTP